MAIFTALFKAQVKACFLIYLTLAAFAEAGVRQAITAGMPLVDMSGKFKTPIDLIIGPEGTDGCDSHLRDTFTYVGDTIYRLKTVDGKTVCNIHDAHPVARQTLGFNGTELEERVPNPTIVTWSVTVLGGSEFGGAITLASLGTVAAIAGALLLLWFGAKALFGGSTTTVEQDETPGRRLVRPRDPPTTLMALPARSKPTNTFSTNDTTHPDTCCEPPPITPKKYTVYLTYNDGDADEQSADNEDQDRDSSISNSCIQQITDQHPDLAGACCSVVQTGSEGALYYTNIGASTEPDPKCPFPPVETAPTR